MTYLNDPTIKEKHKQVIYGTILGGSSIIIPKGGKNYYLAMRDCNDKWLTYKTELLKGLFKDNCIKKDKNTYRCYSIAYPFFKNIYSSFYDGKNKFIDKNVLELLTDQAWMIWFIDAGRRSKKKCYLRTNKFGDIGTKIIADYFCSLDCECQPHLARGRNEVVFSIKGSNEFMNVIKNCIPSFISY